MTIIEIQHEVISGSHFITLTANGKGIEISKCANFTTIAVMNASHAVCRGTGRVFHGDNPLEQALAKYKDTTVRAMIEHAIEIVK